MLNIEKTQIISDVIHDSIVYSGIEDAIISTPIFNRLHRISQSSLVFLTFPSNKVHRFEHSIGTMHIAGEIFYKSICNARKDTLISFLKCIKHEICEWRNCTLQSTLPRELKNTEIDSILNMPFPDCRLYYDYCPSNLNREDRLIYFIAFQSIRIAGLLHDVGHLPYSHILEKALKNLYTEASASKKITPSVKQEFMDIVSPFIDGQNEIHEEFGKLLIKDIEQCILDTLSLNQKQDINYFFVVICFSFASKILSSNFVENTIFSDMHLIIAGVVDADRLDYCSRDAFCSALNMDRFNYKRFINGYTLIQRTYISDNYEHFFFAPPAKNLNMIHDLLRRRYRIFSDINYHHRVHKHEIILEKIICDLGLMELEDMSTITPLPKNVLPLEVSSIWKLVKETKTNTNWLEYQLIQLDDSWLDTLLKHKFFKLYGENYLSIRKNGSIVRWNQFDELISTTKHYYSFIKRSSDFQLIDEAFFQIFTQNTWKVKELNLICEESKGKKYSEFLRERRTFLFTHCINYTIGNLSVGDMKESFYQSVEDALNHSSNLQIQNYIVRSSRFSHGLNTVKAPVFLIEREENSIILEQLSTQRNIFLQEEALTAPFHLYYLPEYNDQNIPCKIDSKKLIDILANVLIDCLKQYIASDAPTV